jgi:hypothetical protein
LTAAVWFRKQGDTKLKLLERTFEVRGPTGLGAKPRPELIGPIFTHLHDTLQDAVRMGFLHSSRATGRIPSSLRAAADVRFVGHSGSDGNATLLHFEVPAFGSVASDLFDQKLLWDDGPQPDQTAFELLGAALNDVRRKQKESNRFDPALLRKVSSYRRILRRGIERIAMPDVALPEHAQIDNITVAAASDLDAATPKSRRVRVTGRLDVMGKSQSLLKLNLPGAVVITALWEGKQPLQELKDFFDHDVLIEGAAVFRPSGSLLRIDADAIKIADATDEFFRKLPQPAVLPDYERIIRLRPTEQSVYARIIASIPAEESDDEFAAAVEAFS